MGTAQPQSTPLLNYTGDVNRRVCKTGLKSCAGQRAWRSVVRHKSRASFFGLGGCEGGRSVATKRRPGAEVLRLRAFLFVSFFVVTVLGARKSAVVVFSKFFNASGPSIYSFALICRVLVDKSSALAPCCRCRRNHLAPSQPQSQSCL